MKKLLKSEIYRSREKCMGPTDVLKIQILRLMLMNSVWTVAVTMLFAPETCAQKKKKKESKTCKHANVNAETCIQMDTRNHIFHDFFFPNFLYGLLWKIVGSLFESIINTIFIMYQLLGYFFLSHLTLFKYHLFTFKYTHLIIFKAQEYLCLTIFEKPMIQVHGKTILSVEFKSIIKAHDSSPWQNNFISGIQNHNQSPWFKAMAIHSSKAQFSLAISKPNFHWHYFIKKKRVQDYQRLAKKKYHVKMSPWQSSYEKTHWKLS